MARKMVQIGIKSMSLCALLTATGSAFALQALDDDTLRTETGQAAFYTSYIDPSASGNTSALGFFSLGLQGTVSLNANINHLQLGCGGVNGAGCDIDLSQVRLSGSTPDANGSYAGSDATLTNPFIQLAIKNPTSLATRQVVGIAFGSQAASGLLSIGQNPNINTPGTPGGTPGGETGINTLSGNFETAVSNLIVPVYVCTFTVTPQCSGFLNNSGNGNLPVYQSASQPHLATDASGTGTFYQYISGSRITGLNMGPLALDASPLGGIAGLLAGLGGVAYAQIMPQNLIDVHNLDISSSSKAGLLLSLNSQAILWPQIGSAGVSSFPTTAQTLNADGTLASAGYNSNGKAITANQLMAQPGWWLSAPQANIGGTATTPLKTQEVDLSLGNAVAALSSPGPSLASINLGQVPTTNCYGGYKFC